MPWLPAMKSASEIWANKAAQSPVDEMKPAQKSRANGPELTSFLVDGAPFMA
jgi:hypothetical protein